MAGRSVFGSQDAAYRITDQRQALPAGAFMPRPKDYEKTSVALAPRSGSGAMLTVQP